jgi:hypothetical protein
VIISFLIVLLFNYLDWLNPIIAPKFNLEDDEVVLSPATLTITGSDSKHSIVYTTNGEGILNK